MKRYLQLFPSAAAFFRSRPSPPAARWMGYALLFILLAVSQGFLGARSTLGTQAELAEVYNLRHYTHPNFTRIVVDIGVLREYLATESSRPGAVSVDIFQARLNPIVREEAIPAGCDYIKLIRISQKTPATVRVTAELDFAKVRRYEVFHVFDPFRIVIDIYPEEAAATAGATKRVPAPQAAKPARSGYSLARQLGLGVKTVVIDPGHGGTDPGCLDSSGSKEKDLTLDISLRLKELLEAKLGLEVILTRETDINVPLETRTVVANQKKADLFISVHVNAYKDRRRRGIETFYLNLSTDPAVNELAAKENATTTKTIGEMDKIIRSIVRNSKIIESRELALKIQQNLVRYLSKSYSQTNDLGAKGGPFWTLIGCEMPSVLVEVAHLTNAEEARRLKDPQFRKQVAQGILEGIAAYLESLGKGL
jgi:N-acetylmuramoyl-L-alanine amidase